MNLFDTKYDEKKSIHLKVGQRSLAIFEEFHQAGLVTAMRIEPSTVRIDMR